MPLFILQHLPFFSVTLPFCAAAQKGKLANVEFGVGGRVGQESRAAEGPKRAADKKVGALNPFAVYELVDTTKVWSPPAKGDESTGC
jgi:hypothetical protein